LMLDEIWALALGLLSIHDEVLREIMNGMWFVLSMEIWLSFVVYIYLRATKPPGEPQWIWVVPVPWRQQVGTQLAMAWALYISGSALRAGWIWALLECHNRIGRNQCAYITETASLLYLASALAIVGGTWMMARVLPESWGKKRILIPPLVAISVPVLVHVAI
jgi:hypothetical protein